MKKILLLFLFQFSIAFAANHAARTIFLIGDSTVTNYRESAYPMAGWGQVLQHYINSSEFVIDNRAIGGRSSRSFIEEGRWGSVKSAMVAGDFVFIQFGHNDRDFSKAERYTPPADYKTYLKQYVNETRALGGIPVLVTPMVLNAWRNGALRNVFTESGAEYVQRMKEVANELNCPLIDLNQKSYNFISTIGADYATRFIYNTYVAGEYPNYPNGLNDYTHFQEMGALKMADYVVEGIRSLSNHADVGKIAASLLPRHSVTITSNVAGAGTITRSDSYPAGATVTLKALTNQGHTFLYWKNAQTNTVVSTNTIYSFAMGTRAVSFLAIFDKDNTPDCAGVPKGTATIDACGICTGGTTGKIACTTSIEAENACSVEGIKLESINDGFTGQGYVNTDNSIGSNAIWNLISETQQTIKANVRFANGGTSDRSMTLYLNDQNLGVISFPSTGNFTTWASTTIDLPLKSGGNKLEFVSTTESGGPNIDLFAFNTNTVTIGTCTLDCNNEFGGTAANDDCGVCSGGNTGLIPNASCSDCNGVLNGTAKLDNCGICIGGTTGLTACTDELQAEESSIVDGIKLETINAGYKGDGYANTENRLGASIRFCLDVNQSGDYILLFRFANSGTTSRGGKILANNSQVGTLSFPPTANWSDWKVEAATCTLQEGKNEIILEALTESGLANLDLIAWSSPDLSKSSCIITGIQTMDNSSITLSPNPFINSATMTTETPVDYTIFNIQGIVVESGICNKNCDLGEKLHPGIYKIIFTTREKTTSKTIIKQ